MENDNSNKRNSDKLQTMCMIGIALIVIGLAIFFVGYSQPKVYVNSKDEIIDDEVTTIQESQVSTSAANAKLSVNYPLNINTATYEELITIDGIGETKANLIINYRNEVGNFTSLEDLKNIKGFGDNTISNLSPYLTV